MGSACCIVRLVARNRQRKQNKSESCCARRGGGLVIAGAIAFYSVYTPLHLSTEHHRGDYGHDHHPAISHAERHGSSEGGHTHDPHHHSHHHNHHRPHEQDSPHEPHPASDHQVLLSTLRDWTISTNLTLFAPSFAIFEIARANGPATVPAQLPEPRKIRPSSPRRIRAPPLL